MSQILVQAATSKALLRCEAHEREKLATQVESLGVCLEAVTKDLQLKEKELEGLRRYSREKQSITLQEILLETNRELSRCLLRERSDLYRRLDTQACALHQLGNKVQAFNEGSSGQLMQIDTLTQEASHLKERFAGQSLASERKLQEQEQMHTRTCDDYQKQLQKTRDEVRELERMNVEHLRQARELHAQNCHLKQSLAFSNVVQSSESGSDRPICQGSTPEAMPMPIPHVLCPDLPMLYLLQNIQRQSEKKRPPLCPLQKTDEHVSPVRSSSHDPGFSPALCLHPKYSLGLHMSSRFLRLCLRK